jgi:hypothetical protein
VVEAALQSLGNAMGNKIKSLEKMKKDLLESAEQAKRDLDKVECTL